LSPDPHTSYGYEFAPVLIDWQQWRGLPKKTWQDFKQAAARRLGPVVPIVRCHDHRPWLNLAVGGRIYESELYWEKNFTDDDHLLTVAKFFAVPGPAHLRAKDFPSRDSRADARLLDLTDYYNAALTNSWQGFPEITSLRCRRSSPVRHARFDVRGVIQLMGPIFRPHSQAGDRHQGPAKVPAGSFLHAVSFFYRIGGTSGFYTFRYADRREEEFTLFYGQQIADWWHDPERSPAQPTRRWFGPGERGRKSLWQDPLPLSLDLGESFQRHRDRDDQF
jgi:hypothetical protein